jgi:uncharacterized membrane protein
MRKTLTFLILVFLVVTIPIHAEAATNPQEQPVVHAVLFWTDGCPYCAQTLTTILPPIQDRYQSQLRILLIELASSADIDNLYAFGASLGLSKEQIQVPFLLIDHRVLVGSDEIKAGLAGIVDDYLSKGGVETPNMPILNEMLPKGIDYASSVHYLHLVAQPSAGASSLGLTLAWGIMILMWVALIAAIVFILRAFQGKPVKEFKSWVNVVIPILALIGLGASIYLTYVELTHTHALCGPVGDCNAVQTSPYAKLFGFLPIGLLGAIGYIALLAAWLWQRLRSDALTKIAGPAMYGMALFGTLFSIYLTYLELFVIHAVCIWCLSSAVIITLLMVLILPQVTQWLAIPDDEE